jgi:hypothetical protein
MSTFVSCGKPSRIGSYVGPTWLNGCFVKVLPRLMGFEVRPTALGPDSTEVEVISGKDMGQRSIEVAANQRVSLTLATISPKKYQCLWTVNPELHLLGQVQFPTVTEPHEQLTLRLVIQANKSFRISDLTWLVRGYIVE